MTYKVRFITPSGETWRIYTDSLPRVRTIAKRYAAKHNYQVALIMRMEF